MVRKFALETEKSMHSLSPTEKANKNIASWEGHSSPNFLVRFKRGMDAEKWNLPFVLGIAIPKTLVPTLDVALDRFKFFGADGVRMHRHKRGRGSFSSFGQRQRTDSVHMGSVCFAESSQMNVRLLLLLFFKFLNGVQRALISSSLTDT